MRPMNSYPTISHGTSGKNKRPDCIWIGWSNSNRFALLEFKERPLFPLAKNPLAFRYSSFGDAYLGSLVINSKYNSRYYVSPNIRGVYMYDLFSKGILNHKKYEELRNSQPELCKQLDEYYLFLGVTNTKEVDILSGL